MKCRQAQKILNDCQWNSNKYCQNIELTEHLNNCPDCRSLLKAEIDLEQNLNSIGRTSPKKQLSLNSIRSKIEQSESSGNSTIAAMQNLFGHSFGKKTVIAVSIAILAIVIWVPFDFNEKVGYGISISGVDKDIAMDSNGIFPLLDALGMTKYQSANLKDSLAQQEIRLYVGDCSETCDLKISDLKTEKDVELVIQAIIELGCCEIDEVFPIFRDQSSSLLEHMTKRLFS